MPTGPDPKSRLAQHAPGVPGDGKPEPDDVAIPGRAPKGAGQALGAGAGTLGANSGGERASAGRGDADRSSRDDHDSLDEDTSGLP